jgi:TIR domain-containing protein
MQAFISHVTEESQVASKLSAFLKKDFLGTLKIFVSAETESIGAGDDWLAAIEAALTESAMLLVLCSPSSIDRPWINFEAGAAWMLGKPVIPLCHGGLTPDHLPLPLSLRQGLSLLEAKGLRLLYARIADELQCQMPDQDYEQRAQALAAVSAPSDPNGEALGGAEASAASGISRRLHQALETSAYKWRSLEWIAVEAAVSEDVAAEVLRDDETVRFSKGKSGKRIVGLIDRVGKGAG